MKFTLSIAVLLIALSCIAEETPVPYYKTEAFKEQYKTRMGQYVANREKKIEEVKASFHLEILPAIEAIKPSLETGRLTEREEGWPPAFKKHGVKFVILRDSQIGLYFHKWVSKAEMIIYYFDPSAAPKKEDTKAEDEDEKKRPNPEILKIFDNLWYWSFRS
jgi:hypothetical protein